jgi:hypothetical protein
MPGRYELAKALCLWSSLAGASERTTGERANFVLVEKLAFAAAIARASRQ